MHTHTTELKPEVYYAIPLTITPNATTVIICMLE